MKKLINQIMEYCEINPKKALMIVEQLDYFLQTEKDCKKFLDQFEERQIWRKRDMNLQIVKLAKEIGAYHYPSKTLDELLQMDEKEALEHLFVAPVGFGRLKQIKESKLSLADLFTMKQQNPKMALVEVLLYA